MSEKDENKNTTTISQNDTDNTANTASNHSSKKISFFTFSEKISSTVYLTWWLIALLPVLILFMYAINWDDPDLWWQMAHGKYYITHHTLKMDLSIFSWTPIDPTWIYNACLGSIIIYLFYNFMGGFGLWLLQSLVFLGVFFAFYLFLRLINQRMDVNILMLIAAIVIACFPTCSVYKPELFSLLLFTWAVFIYFFVKITRRKFLFYLYPLIFALWVNLHGAFIVGFVFLVLTLAGEILNRIFFSRESLTTGELVHFGISFVLSGAATLLNPYGIDYLISLFPTIMNAIGFESYSGEYDRLIEKFIIPYRSLWPFLKNMDFSYLTSGLSVWIMTLMFVSIMGLSVYELIKKKSCDFTLLMVCIALYWKGMDTGRVSYFFPIAFFFFFFYLLIYRLKLKKFLVGASIFSLLLFLFLFISVSYYTIRCSSDKKWFGIGLDSLAPVKEVAFLKKYKLEGPIFNDYILGGNLIWDLYPDYKVFIDPRGAPYRNQVLPDYIEFTTKHVTNEDINRFTEKYPFKIAIIHHRDQAMMFSFLKAGSEWRLLYFEKNASILIHKSLLPAIMSKMGKEIKDPELLMYIFNNPSRFSNETNPQVLMDVFNIYVRMDPKAGRFIYDVFKNNVSDYWWRKTESLQYMNTEIQRIQYIYNKTK
jgi:hypothetical protein